MSRHEFQCLAAGSREHDFIARGEQSHKEFDYIGSIICYEYGGFIRRVRNHDGISPFCVNSAAGNNIITPRRYFCQGKMLFSFQANIVLVNVLVFKGESSP